jgi:hypothetical protein
VRPAQFGNLETHFNKDDFEGKQKSFWDYFISLPTEMEKGKSKCFGFITVSPAMFWTLCVKVNLWLNKFDKGSR